MNKCGYYFVNGITFYRMIAAPILVLLIFNGQVDIFKWLLGFSFFTDVIDGWLARKYKVASKLGATLDSIADDLTIVAGIIGVIVFKPEFLTQQIVFIIPLLALFVLQICLAFIRYGKISSFHTYLAKLAALMQGFFLILLFFLRKPVYALFYAAYFVTVIDLVEEIILVLLLPEWQNNVKGLYWVFKKKQNKLQ
jgi:CDP-diacylglycerol--glycerol-3-phosphate 3-phosphatidyltransferase